VLTFLQSYQGKHQAIRINIYSSSIIYFPLVNSVDHLNMNKKNKHHTQKVSKMLQDFRKLELII
jgi:hypothetical protein